MQNVSRPQKQSTICSKKIKFIYSVIDKLTLRIYRPKLFGDLRIQGVVCVFLFIFVTFLVVFCLVTNLC